MATLTERAPKRPFGCKCETFGEHVLGDGCDECQKQSCIDNLVEQQAQLERENQHLRVLVEQAADWLDYMGRTKSAATLREAINS
jgi:hypothetical protein